uniref:OTU domain-containing protein n=1 Tax=Aplanochytrium stocchinoi TaxID=215587 RepID=A0A6S8BS44_9STRA
MEGASPPLKTPVSTVSVARPSGISSSYRKKFAGTPPEFFKEADRIASEELMLMKSLRKSELEATGICSQCPGISGQGNLTMNKCSGSVLAPDCNAYVCRRCCFINCGDRLDNSIGDGGKCRKCWFNYTHLKEEHEVRLSDSSEDTDNPSSDGTTKSPNSVKKEIENAINVHEKKEMDADNQDGDDMGNDSVQDATSDGRKIGAKLKAAENEGSSSNDNKEDQDIELETVLESKTAVVDNIVDDKRNEIDADVEVEVVDDAVVDDSYNIDLSELDIRGAIGDNNCWLHVVSEPLNMDSRQVKRDLFAYCNEKRTFLRIVLRGGAKEVRSFLQNLQKDDHWGGRLEHKMLMLMLKIKINRYELGKNNKCKFVSAKSQFGGEDMDLYDLRVKNSQTEVAVLYNGRDHYDRVVIHGKCDAVVGKENNGVNSSNRKNKRKATMHMQVTPETQPEKKKMRTLKRSSDDDHNNDDNLYETEEESYGEEEAAIDQEVIKKYCKKIARKPQKYFEHDYQIISDPSPGIISRLGKYHFDERLRRWINERTNKSKRPPRTLRLFNLVLSKDHGLGLVTKVTEKSGGAEDEVFLVKINKKVCCKEFKITPGEAFLVGHYNPRRSTMISRCRANC